MKKISKAEKKRRRATADARRVETIKRKKGPNWFSENAKHAGSLTPTKFTSDTSRNANKVRWDRYRAEQAKLRQKGENNGRDDS